ncbi:MAG: DnaB helicase C-terminal domain-containing protein [Acidimicrobiales bacterium]|jgi:hypothetical protein|nr:DnaB helicase C-terminal domain-containing protein [Acidimicrobiales bacterium]
MTRRRDPGGAHGWRPERSLPITDALHRLLDDLEQRYDTGGTEHPPDPWPLRTGVAEFDRVCGGGLHVGWVTVIEADQAAQARALLCSIARHVDHPVLVDVPSVREATTWLLAGASGVPAACVASGMLSQADWDAIAREVPGLAARDLHLSEASTLDALAHVVDTTDPAVVLVHELERLGDTAHVLASLSRLAARGPRAVAATVSPCGDLPTWALDRVTRVGMFSHGLAGRAALMGLDDFETATVAQVAVDCLTARWG